MADGLKRRLEGRHWLAVAVLMAAACGVAAYWRFRVIDASPVSPVADNQAVVSSPRPQPSQTRIRSADRPLHEPATAPVAVTASVRQALDAIAALVTDGGKSADDDSLGRLAAKILPANLPQVIGYLLRLDGTTDQREWGVGLLRYWADADPRTAAQWLDSEPALADREAAVKQVATAWADQDLDGALDWVHHLRAGAERQSALRAALEEGAQSDPTAAMTVAIRELPAGAERDDFLRYATAQWAAAEPEAALAWAKQLDDPALRDRVIATVATEWSTHDPVAGATLAIERLPAGRLQSDAIVGIVERWVQIDPRAAADWVATGFPEGELRRTAVTEMVKIWAERDLEQVGQWLAELQSGSVRDAAQAIYDDKLALRSAGQVTNLAQSLKN